VARDRDAPAAVPVTLWSRFANAPPQEFERARWRIAAGIAGFVVVSLGFEPMGRRLGLGPSGGERERGGARENGSAAAATRALAAIARRAQAGRARLGVEADVLARRGHARALSRALPDGAYLTELQFEKATLRITGLTRDAPSLIAPLERSGHLADVHFLAPTTRNSDGSLFRFNIEARVEPRLELTEN